MPEKVNKDSGAISAGQRILDAAIEEFTEKGYAGARMQSIADKAEISKSALHYYYRHKERLFWTVLDETVGKTINRLKLKFNKAGNFEEKLVCGIREYYRSITKNISIVKFLLIEVNRNPEIISRFLDRVSYFSWIGELEQELEKEYKAGRIYKITGTELILNLISLCIFPQFAAPMARKVLRKTESEYEEIISMREEQVVQMMVKIVIKPN